MTDNDIIEGLRCCNNGLCEICPYHEDEFIADCREQNGNDALDLIKRQQAEIERLKAIEAMEEKQHHYCKDVCYPNHKAEIERLTEEKDNLIRTYKECQVAILVDFAEKLMGVYTDKFGSTKESLVSYIVQKEIKKLVKEMTEGEV